MSSKAKRRAEYASRCKDALRKAKATGEAYGVRRVGPLCQWAVQRLADVPSHVYCPYVAYPDDRPHRLRFVVTNSQRRSADERVRA